MTPDIHDLIEKLGAGLEGVLCYVEHDRAWFTTAPLDKQWGDDWDDAPYEHNAGSPYQTDGARVFAVPIDPGFLQTPGQRAYANSRFSVQRINAGETPWLSGEARDGSPIRVMAGATVAELQDALTSAFGTILTPFGDIRALLSHIAALSADLASAKEALDAETEACAQIAAKGVYYRIRQGNCFAQSVDIAAAIRARTTLRSLNKEDGR